MPRGASCRSAPRSRSAPRPRSARGASCRSARGRERTSLQRERTSRHTAWISAAAASSSSSSHVRSSASRASVPRQTACTRVAASRARSALRSRSAPRPADRVGSSQRSISGPIPPPSREASGVEVSPGVEVSRHARLGASRLFRGGTSTARRAATASDPAGSPSAGKSSAGTAALAAGFDGAASSRPRLCRGRDGEATPAVWVPVCETARRGGEP